MFPVLTREGFNQEARDAIPVWEGLLQVYGALFLPVIFAVLFELNLYAWVRARINYEVWLINLPR